MARHNYVRLHGQVMSEPNIQLNEDGVPVRAMFYVVVMERPNYNPDGSKTTQRYDCPIVISLNEKIIRQIAELKLYDMVDINGVLCTIRTYKQNFCTECKEKNKVEGQGVYINPIYICKRESENMTASKGRAILKERAEISNSIDIIGNLCDDPEYFEEPGTISNCSYCVAVNRKIRIKEDSEDVKTDYPWVKTFGAMAKEDSERLQKGSHVFIHGMIRTREPERMFVCQHCGSAYTAKDSVVDIVPYSVEYLSDFKKSESDNDENENNGMKMDF